MVMVQYRPTDRTDGVGHDHVTSIYRTSRFLRFYRRATWKASSIKSRPSYRVRQRLAVRLEYNAANPSLRCTLLAWERHIPDRPYPATLVSTSRVEQPAATGIWELTSHFLEPS